jgi:hypothetical protein
LPRVRSLRALSDEDQEDDRKRQGHAENRAREPIERRDDDEDREWNDESGRQSRNIAPPIRLYRCHRVGQHRHQFAGRRVGQPDRSEGADVIQQVVKQGLSHTGGGLEGSLIGDPAEPGADER